MSAAIWQTQTPTCGNFSTWRPRWNDSHKDSCTQKPSISASYLQSFIHAIEQFHRRLNLVVCFDKRIIIVSMGLTECVLNVVVPPSAMLALLFAWPVLAFVKTCRWVVSWFVHENVRGKVVLITGASSGIGEHIAYQYAKKGARLVLAARREPQLRAVADQAISKGASDAHVLIGDITKEDDCKMLVDQTIEKYGRLDHLVNNAGNVNSFFFADATDTKAFHTVVDVDFWGPVYMTHFALPHLRSSHGKIMVIASLGSWLQHPRESIYNAAKAGVLQLFDTLRVELGKAVSITIVMPGFTESEATRGKMVDEKGDVTVDPDRRDAQFGPMPMAHAETVAKAAVNGTIRGYRYVITPFYYSVLLLFRLFAPELIDAQFYFQTVKNRSRPLNKQIIDAGAGKVAYTKSTQKEE